MHRFKIGLMLLSIGLIFIDKYSPVSRIRDNIAVFLEKNTSLMLYRVQNYPQLVILKVQQQQELAGQNVQLKKQVEEYSMLLKQSKNQIQDAKLLNDLSQKGIYEDFSPTIAKAVLDVNFFVNNQLLIDQGANKDIKLGYAVVNKDGVIGQISNVNPNNSQIRLITNPDYKIYVEHSVSKTKMLAQGGGNNTIIVRYIDKNDKIKIGDILETTGLDDIYPAQIPVAKVTKVFYENNGFNSAICEPVVDFRQLQYVSVLKSDS